MIKRQFICIITFLTAFFMIALSAYAEDSLEKSLEKNLNSSQSLLKYLDNSTHTSSDLISAFASLKTKGVEIHQIHLMLEEKFKQAGDLAGTVSGSAAARHTEMVNLYKSIIPEYLRLLDSLESIDDLESGIINEMLQLILKAIPEKEYPILGSLPYRHLNYAAQKPVVEPLVIPAYVSGDLEVTEADLLSTPLAPASSDIAALAESLNWSPVEIFEWVKNNIETEWYFGSMKGAEETLRQKSGNDCDQAALLIAMFRASGYPARYIRGVAEFYPDIETAAEVTGVKDTTELPAFFQKAGIPYDLSLKDGKISNISFEHIWVEVLIPYENYRGTISDEQGKIWLGIDSSIKTAGFEETEAHPFLTSQSLTHIRNEYLTQSRDVSLLSYLQKQINNSIEVSELNISYDNLLGKREQNPEKITIIPPQLQFNTVAVTGEYADIPDELIHKIQFKAAAEDKTVLFDQMINVADLTSKRIKLTYEPDTVEDQEIINSFGGLSRTPAYMIKMRPVIEIDNKRTIIGLNGLIQGEIFDLEISVISPVRHDAFVNKQVTGNLSVIGVVAQKPILSEAIDPANKTGTDIFHEMAIGYMDQWSSSENELASLLDLKINRPVLSVVTIGNVAEVNTLFGKPFGLDFKGVFIDADFRSVDVFNGIDFENESDAGNLFMQLSSLQGSVLENMIMEQHLEVDGISTARLFGVAFETGTELKTITDVNVDSVLDSMTISNNVKTDIKLAAAQGLTVLIPEHNISWEDFTGIGYIKENPVTGESGWMLSGMIAGGMTAWRPDRWLEYYNSRMENNIFQVNGLANQNPLEAIKLIKLGMTDLQNGVAGQSLGYGNELKVVARDICGNAVEFAEVKFTILNGGGTFADGSTSIVVETDFNGVAEALLICGEKTDANPTFMMAEGYTYAQQVGENIITAELTAIGISLDVPFTVYGFPDTPANIFVNSVGSGSMLTLSGIMYAKLQDQHGNPVSNETVVFDVQPAVIDMDDIGACHIPVADSRESLVVQENDPCIDGFPGYEDCNSAASSIEVITGHIGAKAYLMAGARPGISRIDISSGSLSTHETSIILSFGNCDEVVPPPPVEKFWLKTKSIVDSDGNIVTAAKPGVKVNMQANIYFLREEDKIILKEYICDSDLSPLYEDSRICDFVAGASTFMVDTDFTNSNVTFAGNDGSTLGAGIFSYEYEVQPGINRVNIQGSADITVMRSNEPECEDPCLIVEETVNGIYNGEKIIYGVEVITPPSIDIATNDEGKSVCDVNIDFTITPLEYKAASAYLVIYEQGQAVAYIPVETSGTGFGTLARGFEFDDSLDYEAKIILNPGSGSSAEIESDAFPLNPGFIKITNISIKDPELHPTILPEDEITFVADTEPAGKEIELEWTIKKLGNYIDVSINKSTGLLTVGRQTLDGWVIVRAQDSKNSCIYRESYVYIGCISCGDSGSSCSTDAVYNLSSIDVKIGLGKTDKGVSAGSLIIKSDTPSALLATPAGLTLSTLTKDFEEKFDENNQLRQVLTHEYLVDIVTINQESYEIKFYSPEEINGESDGVYLVNDNNYDKKWTIETNDSTTHLKVTESHYGGRSFEYFYNTDSGDWKLLHGDGLKIEELKEDIEGDKRTTTRIISGKTGITASKSQTVYQSFDWGEEIVEEIIDPDGEKLTSTTGYYTDKADTGSYKKIKSQISQDGSWIRYEYDQEGRVLKEISTYLDAPISAGEASARVREYSYQPVDGSDAGLDKNKSRPRTITEKVQTVIVSKTYHAYLTNSQEEKTTITERVVRQSAGYGASDNFRTVTVTHPSGTDTAESGRVKSITYPDGRISTYTYEFGNYSSADFDSPGVFTAGSGEDRRTTVFETTEENPSGIVNKSTRSVTVSNKQGHTLLQATEVYTGSGFDRLTWTANVYDESDRLVVVFNSDGTSSDTNWSCCFKESDTNAEGIITDYTYDELKRVINTTMVSDQLNAKTIMTYDGAGRVIKRTTLAGDLQQTTHAKYDGAGRMIKNIDAAGRVSETSYSSDGRTTTATMPGGITQISESHMDGRAKSTTGTGSVPTFYEYGVNSDGSRWTTVYTGTLNGPLWSKTTTDMAGRTILTEQNGYEDIVRSENFYNVKGQLERTIQTGSADIIYIYDDYGNRVLSGQDINKSGSLELASSDRITGSDTQFVSIDNNWWQENVSHIYASAGSDAETTVSTSRTKITGFGTDNEISRSMSMDIHGNTVTNWLLLDRGTQTKTSITDYPDSNIDETAVSVSGLLKETTSKTGLTVTYIYDALGRRTGVMDPRTGTSEIHYNAKGFADWVEDADNNRTTFAYDPDTGRKLSATNALNKKVYYKYNVRGQVTHTWGDATYPVMQEYDDFGRITAMHTYREATGFTGSIFPESATGDITRWDYHETTGLLQEKEYADGGKVAYTYTPEGKLFTREWARDHNGNPLLTTYTYDDLTAELTDIDYSDDTQDVSFSYDRLGRQETVTDAMGSRTFTYTNTLQPHRETISGLYNEVLERTYETSGVTGRYNGINLGADYSVSYGYQTDGRFGNINYTAKGKSGTATYGYQANSNLINSLAFNSGLATQYTYEPNRNLKTAVINRQNTDTVSQYTYTYDALGQRKNVVNTGTAFAASAFSDYKYNDRNELTEASRFWGQDPNNTTTPVESEYRAYNYDTIGNRITATKGTDQTGYTSAPLNQYSETTGASPETFGYDEDGNMTTRTSGIKYQYNAENRLIVSEPETPTEGDLKSEFLYDYMGRRVKKTVSTYSSGSWLQLKETLFVYDGWNLMKEMVSENTDPVVHKYYVWGLDLSQSSQGAGGVGGLLVSIDEQADTHHQYLYDANGNVGQLVNTANDVIDAHYEYDPFGNTIRSDGAYADENSFRFSTKFFDKETSLYYYGYRYYSPELGRWINRDPLGEDGGLNLYGFVGNDVINEWDILGERKSGSFTAKGTGHHIIPIELWEMFGFPDEAKKVFDDATKAVPSYEHKGKLVKHNFTGHGPKTGYTGHVRDEIAKYIRSKGLSGKKLKADEYVKLAEEVVAHIKNSPNKFISGFLKNVDDPRKLTKWNKTVGKNLARPLGLAATKFTGFKRVKIPRLTKCGRKVPIVKYVLLVGVVYLWDADYNNARADGYGPAQAGSIATARAADPGLEMAWDFGYGVGTFVNNNVINGE